MQAPEEKINFFKKQNSQEAEYVLFLDFVGALVKWLILVHMRLLNTKSLTGLSESVKGTGESHFLRFTGKSLLLRASMIVKISMFENRKTNYAIW